MTDFMSLVKLEGKVQSTEIYNLAAQSHIQLSFDAPEFTEDIDAIGNVETIFPICEKTSINFTVIKSAAADGYLFPILLSSVEVISELALTSRKTPKGQEPKCIRRKYLLLRSIKQHYPHGVSQTNSTSGKSSYDIR